LFGHLLLIEISGNLACINTEEIVTKHWKGKDYSRRLMYKWDNNIKEKTLWRSGMD